MAADRMLNIFQLIQLEEELEEFDDIILAAEYILEVGKKQRQLWVHPIFQQRGDRGAFATLVRELRQHEEKFKAFFRMTKEQYDTVLDAVKHDIEKKDTKYRYAISASERLAICLRWDIVLFIQ